MQLFDCTLFVRLRNYTVVRYTTSKYRKYTVLLIGVLEIDYEIEARGVARLDF